MAGLVCQSKVAVDTPQSPLVNKASGVVQDARNAAVVSHLCNKDGDPESVGAIRGRRTVQRGER